MSNRPLDSVDRLTAPSLCTKLLLALLSTVLLGQDVRAEPINWRTSHDSAVAEANRTGKLVLLHFYTSSCGPCKQLERDVFSQPQIAAAIEKDFVPVKLNADNSPAYANQYQITRVPSEVVLTPRGNIVQKLSCPLEPNAYGSQLVNIANHYGRRSANGNASSQAPLHSAYAGLQIGPPPSPNVGAATPPANNAPTVPTITRNPYLNPAPPTAPAQVAQQQPAAANLPLTTIDNRYGNRYPAMAAQAPPVAKKPVTQPAPITVAKAPTTPPLTPPVTPPVTPPIAATPPAPTVAVAATPAIAKTPALPATSRSTTTPPPTAKEQVATVVPADVWPPELPAGTPQLAFDGYCPVSLKQVQKWVRGKKTFGAIHRGRTYLFAGEAQRSKFLATPDAYSPVFSGNDPVMMLDENKQVAGSRKYGFAYRDAFYLFTSKETMARFASQPDRYSAGVRQAMTRMDAAAGNTIRR